MLKIAICDDSRTDVEMLECAFDKLRQYPIEYDVYFSGEELLKYYTLHTIKVEVNFSDPYLGS